ncbi:hypothetical protein NIE88_09540 [Sporolactobacillus shoreicorticis]|uniref:Uncharacterized protein n=1 Tax=Sporolactobacillus shoreicorticis TaxID=1923877 RepID=A0ABW5S9B6_9BACL|nr:hypothetical protein [Sporolactobacillus shoreicorticis]MCO7126017.1 hypothetical protein [Sporolactobacillus shoreicorticis]
MNPHSFKFGNEWHNAKDLMHNIDLTQTKLGLLNILQTAINETNEQNMRKEVINEAIQLMTDLGLTLY